jgi:hypothetical protein
MPCQCIRLHRQVENSQLHANDSTCRRRPSDEYCPSTVRETNLQPIVVYHSNRRHRAILHVEQDTGE